MQGRAVNFSPTYLFICLNISIWTQKHLLYSLSHNLIQLLLYLLLKLFQLWPLKSHLVWLLCPFNKIHSFWAPHCFLTYLVFSLPRPGINHFPRNFRSFYKRIVFGTKSGCWGNSFLLECCFRALSVDRANPVIHTHLYVCIYAYIYI